MKKLVAVVLASAAMLPVLSYAQSSDAPANALRSQSQQQDSMKHGWVTQPSAQALGQALYKHH